MEQLLKALLLDNIKDKKILVFKKRRRQNSRKRYGHRQPFQKFKLQKFYLKMEKLFLK